MSSSRPSRKHRWLTHRKAVDRYTREARVLLATQQPGAVTAALDLLDAALDLSPRNDGALELKARALLFLRRFKGVADMLQDYIPSFRNVAAGHEEEENTSTSLSSGTSSSSEQQQLQREREKALLLPHDLSASDGEDGPPRCLSVSDLKRRVLCGLLRSRGREGQWRYMVLGQACCQLGMMEDALALLQTGRRIAAASCRRECLDLQEDSFSDNLSVDFDHHPTTITALQSGPAELEAAAALLNHIKLLLRRRAAAYASLEAGLPSDSIRHFSKILDSRRGIPHVFAAGCFIGRASAFKATGRFADAIADCNRALAIDPASIPSLRARAELLESVGSLQDSLRDLDHLKLLYDAVLWERKLPGPAWRPHNGVRYREINGSLRALTSRIRELRQRVARGEGFKVDYYALFGLKKGCSRSELERAHLLLSLKHKPDKATSFIDRIEFSDDNRDVDMVKDEAKMSASILYRHLQKGYANIMVTIVEEENAARQSNNCSVLRPQPPVQEPERSKLETNGRSIGRANSNRMGTAVPRSSSFQRAVTSPASSVFQGVFCRDLAVVNSLISKASYSQSIPVKYEALSC